MNNNWFYEELAFWLVGATFFVLGCLCARAIIM